MLSHGKDKNRKPVYNDFAAKKTKQKKNVKLKNNKRSNDDGGYKKT